MQKKTLSTNSGMWLLWNYESFEDINDYGDWANVFEEESEIIKQMKKRLIVPININSDGVFDFEIKLNEKLNSRENSYKLVSSRDYLISSSGKLILSGIEFVDSVIKEGNAISIDTEKGYYKVKVHLIDWKKENNALDENNNPMPNALPDFVIEISSYYGSITSTEFSHELNTFEK